MSSTIKQTVLRLRPAFFVLIAIVLFPSVARAQMGDSGGAALGAGGLDTSGGEASPDDSQNGAVSNTMRRGCIDPNDPNAADSGLPPCTNSDTGSDESQGGQSTLSGGAAGPGASTAAHGPQGFGNAQGFANTVNKQSMAAVIQQLGLSPDELGSLKNEMASGGLSPDDMQELCLHFAAKQLSAADVTGIAKSLGLTFTDQQLAQLKAVPDLPGRAADRTRPRHRGSRWT